MTAPAPRGGSPVDPWAPRESRSESSKAPELRKAMRRSRTGKRATAQARAGRPTPRTWAELGPGFLGRLEANVAAFSAEALRQAEQADRNEQTDQGEEDDRG